MVQVVVTRPAEADVAEIVVYLAESAGPQVAARYLAEFDAVYDRLAHFPDIGSLRRKLGRQTRIVLVDPYVIVYDHIGGTVTVLRVLHARRNITPRLIRQPES